ncbi:hypothetical protein AAL_03974 [Moelleriella libera RCEF 2490]|uniref:Uncharacterized protein n=1 Tax=Moelleriella libera RCEF 2490 TaxID=1081109 RepID=A0A168CLA8_9HYPO|nr:hypothetical protein AAL_03974 [Moelleriella libera RCEF 2490]
MSLHGAGNFNGWFILPFIPPCVTALGPWAVGAVAACLSTSNVDLFTQGTTMVSCMLNAILGSCLNTLPASCLNLAGLTGPNLISAIAKCITDLGPFAVGSTLQCLTTDLTTGDASILCMAITLGLPRSSIGGTIGGGVGCPPARACLNPATLPPPCPNILSKNGFDLIPLCLGCITSLGNFAVTAVLNCLSTSAITLLTTGGSVFNCLSNAVKNVCITTLPVSCTNLLGLKGNTLNTATITCLNNMGPFVTTSVLNCVQAATVGDDVVNCLYKFVFGVSLNGT